MSEKQILEGALSRTASRRRWQSAWKGLWRGFLAGAVVWLAALVVYKLAPLPVSMLGWAGGVSALIALSGFLAGFWRKPTLLDTARWVDIRENLNERVSTALEISDKRQDEWGSLVLADAARCADRINPKRLAPWNLPTAARWSLLTLAVCVGLGFVPEYRTEKFLQTQRETEVIRETGQRLAALTRRKLEDPRPMLDSTQKSLESVAELGNQLAKAKLTRNDALKDLASVTEKIREQARELTKNPGLQRMQRAARAPSSAAAPSMAELQKKMEELQKALGENPPDSEAIQKLKQDLEKAQNVAAAMQAQQASGADATAAQNQLSQMLSQMSRQAGEMGLQLPSLDDAIAALTASQADQLLRDLEFTEIELEKLQSMAEAIAKLQEKAQEIGKNLAEQLENGQAEAAQSTLMEMAKKLQSGQMNKDEMEKLMKEISAALDPAGQYGECKSFLKQAQGEMQSGKEGEAAQSLAKAADELNALMQQMQDAEGLMASLKALQKAQMCIGNCQNWSQMAGPPRSGKGGGLGAGVGTWADDSRLMDVADIKDRWDNSGVVRADEDARGHSDRGDGQLPDTLAPTKVRGQMNPGAAMPSVTLKGVSIKGMSQVQFSEVVSSAQSEAQSALNQEEVPRAYQGAVRDYFDDFK